MTRDEWLALAKRCEAAESANYSLECDISAGFNPNYELPGKALTGSFGAIAEVIEDWLPECGVLYGKGRSRPKEPLYGVVIFKTIDNDPGDERNWLAHGESNHSLALAACAAFCRAMAERAR